MAVPTFDAGEPMSVLSVEGMVTYVEPRRSRLVRFIRWLLRRRDPAPIWVGIDPGVAGGDELVLVSWDRTGRLYIHERRAR